MFIPRTKDGKQVWINVHRIGSFTDVVREGPNGPLDEKGTLFNFAGGGEQAVDESPSLVVARIKDAGGEFY